MYNFTSRYINYFFFLFFVHRNDLEVFVDAYYKLVVERSRNLFIRVYLNIFITQPPFSKRRHVLPLEWDLVGNQMTQSDDSMGKL